MEEKKVRIITHNGTFHADELLAVAAIELYLDGKPYEVIRTRDPEIWKTGDFVVDVGGVYDPSTNRFDHHQHGGAGTRQNGIPYSAFGLVWKHYGESIAGGKEVALVIDQQIGHPVDLGDNGIDYYGIIRQDTEPLIIQFMVAMFRPTWKGGATHDERFMELLDIMRRMLELTISVERDAFEGGKFVEEAYQAAEDKRLVIIDKPYPWGSVLAAHPEPLYIVKPKSVGTHWEVRCVRDNPFGFANRKDLPEAWRGILEMDNKLPSVTGVPDAVFCHSKRYIAVAKSKEGALKLAELALSA